MNTSVIRSIPKSVIWWNELLDLLRFMSYAPDKIDCSNCPTAIKKICLTLRENQQLCVIIRQITDQMTENQFIEFEESFCNLVDIMTTRQGKVS